MSTITDEHLIAKLLQDNGHFEGDPQALRVYRYRGREGLTAFAVFWYSEHDDMAGNPYIEEYELLWDREYGLTPQGEEFLEDDFPARDFPEI